MKMSSSKRGGSGWFHVGGVVAEHRPDHVDAAAGQGDECLFVGFPLGAFAVVEGP